MENREGSCESIAVLGGGEGICGVCCCRYVYNVDFAVLDSVDEKSDVHANMTSALTEVAALKLLDDRRVVAFYGRYRQCVSEDEGCELARGEEKADDCDECVKL